MQEKLHEEKREQRLQQAALQEGLERAQRELRLRNNDRDHLEPIMLELVVPNPKDLVGKIRELVANKAEAEQKVRKGGRQWVSIPHFVLVCGRRISETYPDPFWWIPPTERWSCWRWRTRRYGGAQGLCHVALNRGLPRATQLHGPRRRTR